MRDIILKCVVFSCFCVISVEIAYFSNVSLPFLDIHDIQFD